MKIITEQGLLRRIFESVQSLLENQTKKGRLIVSAINDLTAAVDRLTVAVNRAASSVPVNQDPAIQAQAARVDAITAQLDAAFPVAPPPPGV